MASTPKATSRWGSFLQQAVAGVESRLDTILADDDSTSSAPSKEKDAFREQPAKKEQMAVPSGARSSGELSRQSSTSRRHDRLQERLAKAVVNRNAGTMASTSPGGEDQVIGSSESATHARTNSELKTDEMLVKPDGDSSNESTQRPSTDASHSENALQTTDPSFTLSEPSSELCSSPDAQKQERDASVGLTPAFGKRSDDITSSGVTSRSSADYEEVFHQMRSDNETAELRRQEEIHQYIERIDALQAKLQYYMKEAIEAAKKATEEAKPGSAEQRLAQKDEKIALLMEEGQKLSQNEMKQLTIIKRLRAKSAEDDKNLAQLERSHEQAEKTRAGLNDKLKRVQAVQLEETERQKRTEKELERFKVECASRVSTIASMKTQIDQAKAPGPGEDLTKYKSLFDEERVTTANLREELSTIQIEKRLAEDRHRGHLAETQEKMNREKDRSRVAELELQGEIGVLESRLETYRARAEEVSSGSSGDTQAKLYRQIETLQGQYSVASENWRGIESSLLARIVALEKDRDDLNKRETELRRKAREATHECRKAEEELEQAANTHDELNVELTKEVEKSTAVREALIRSRADLSAVQAELTTTKEELRLHQAEAEKREQQALETTFTQPRTPSPLPMSSKSSADRPYHDKLGHHRRRPQSGPGLGLIGVAGPLDRPIPRRTSTQPSQIPPPTVRQDSVMSTSQSSTRGSVHSIPQMPYFLTEQPDELFDGVQTPATPERTINDMFSASTAAAGPSIQLVERMSAAIRRFESEKAASKDELERISAQRDEAREQVVSLIRETEGKQAADKRITILEAEVATLDRRYQTTLEMLGEKSELVEELQADIADMKQIYKDALEKSMK